MPGGGRNGALNIKLIINNSIPVAPTSKQHRHHQLGDFQHRGFTMNALGQLLELHRCVGMCQPRGAAVDEQELDSVVINCRDVALPVAAPVLHFAAAVMSCPCAVMSCPWPCPCCGTWLAG